MKMKNISILGIGAVGQTLAAGFIKHDHDFKVVMGTEHPEKKREWRDTALSGIPVMGYEEAAQEGEIIILAVKGLVAESVVKRIEKNIGDKTVIDTTNPIADAPPEQGIIKYFTSLDDSLMERLQKIAPDAYFVKAFNSVGSSLMVNPQLKGGKPTMFICGIDDDAKKDAADILDMFGWEVEDMGGVAAARAIEPLAILWCIPGFLHNDWMHAFTMLRP